MRLLLALLALHTWVNTRLLRRPAPAPVRDRVSVLVPARDEAASITRCVEALVGQGALEGLVLDDGSTDATADRARAAGATVIAGAPLPDGWLGKPWACQQLADAAQGDVLVFVDADTVLAPGAVGAAASMLDGLDLVSPYPRQEAPGLTGLVQPLLQWSWLTFLPVELALRSPRPSLGAAGGQLLLVRRDAYRRAGGHAAVRDQVVEDLALLRNVKRAGGRGGVVDGTELATSRMYASFGDLADGYAKSLHTVPPAVPALLAGLYLVPLLGRHRVACWGLGVLGRLLSARRTGGSAVASLAHPVSVALLVGLDARSRVLARRGGLVWKGRRL